MDISEPTVAENMQGDSQDMLADPIGSITEDETVPTSAVFDVLQYGIASDEYLQLWGETERYLSEFEYLKKVGTVTYTIPVDKTYNRSWKMPYDYECGTVDNPETCTGYTPKVRKSKYTSIPHLKKAVCVWNNQNYSFDFQYIYLPLMMNGKSKKIPIRALLVDGENRNFNLLNNKLGTLRITKKQSKWIAQIAVTIPDKQSSGGVSNVMGVDLGLKVPAVAVTTDDKVNFFGNGRQNKYMKRKFRATRKKLGEAKKVDAIRN